MSFAQFMVELMTGARPFINLQDYCKIDGTTDDSVNFTAAYLLAAANNLALWHPGGTLIKGNDTILPGVFIAGPGPGLATIKLKNGANTDLFSAYTSNINLATTPFGSGPTTGLTTPWGISGITLDGNKANQTAGPSYVLRYYGWGEILQNVMVQNGYSGGLLRDWSAATPNALTGSWEDININSNNGDGLIIGGPTDLKLNKIFPNNNYGNNWHIGPNASALNAVNCHAWAPNNAAGRVANLLCEAPECIFSNCEFEGSNFAQAVFLASKFKFNGWVFAGTASGAGIKIGQQSNETPILNQVFQNAGATTQQYVSGYMIDALITDITSSNGSIWFDADAGQAIIKAVVSQTSGVYTNGFIDTNSAVIIQGNGLTPDGSQGKGSLALFFNDAYTGYAMGRQSDGSYVYVVDTYDRTVTLENGSSLAGYSDAFTTQQWIINGSTGNITTNGNIKLGNSSTIYSGSGAPSSGTGANGDFYFRTDTPGTANQRLYVKSAGSWVGII